jgi:hypothetical protein
MAEQGGQSWDGEKVAEGRRERGGLRDARITRQAAKPVGSNGIDLHVH